MTTGTGTGTSAHATGTIIDSRYKLVRLLGAGGMGEVWIAHQSSLDRDVALKLMRGNDAGLVARFQREARAVSKVHHDNVVVVHDTGTCAATGASFIAMELIEGESLRDVVKRGAVALPEGVEILRHILAGLAAAHAVGIIHRDIKPENVMLARGAHGTRAKLVDFGIARAVESGDTMTMTGSFVGTPGYTPPEVALGAPNNNPKGDLYAVGCIAWELFAGRPVFSAPNALAVAMKHASEPAPLLSTARTDVPAHVDALVARLLDKSPERRPTAADALGTLEGGRVDARQRIITNPRAIIAPSQAVEANVVTETATRVVSLEGNDGDVWTNVTSTPYAAVDVNIAKHIVRFVRTTKKTTSDELDDTWRIVFGRPGGLDPKSAGLLVDFRLAPPRNDPVFEAKVDQWLKQSEKSFRRTAALVKSATGRLQAMRNQREHKQTLTVFTDEDEAMRFLTAP
jgi:serine/threonine protein kinase